MTDLTKKIEKGLEVNYSSLGWTGSFYEFIDMVEKKPYLLTRTAFQYLKDTIHYFGHSPIEDCGDQITRYKIFDDPFDNGEHAVYGLDRTLMKIVSNLKTISEGGGKERIIILHGPVATAKTSIIRLITKGLEEYSKSNEGALYTFNWAFPEQITTHDLGFRLPHLQKEAEKEAGKSYAHLKDEELIGNIPCQLNDNPLLLIPKKDRREILEKLVKGKFLIPQKILEGELCYNCQGIQSALLKKYNGDMKKVMKHVQIERIVISEIKKIGATTVQPIQNTEGNAPLVAWENSNYVNVAQFLKGLKIHQFEGKWVDSNRGLIHLTDMFHKNPAYLQHLLSAVEEHLVDFNGIQGFIDSVIIGTTNQEAYSSFKQNPTNKGLKSRIRTVDIGYVLMPKEEAKIYKKEFEEAGYKTRKEKEDDGHIYPHVLDMLSLWAVMSRLQKPEESNYNLKGFSFGDKDVSDLVNPLIKARLYDGELHDSLTLEEKKTLSDKLLQKELRNEFSNEGMFGISPRSIQNLITDTISRKELEEAKKGTKKGCLSFFRLRDSIENFIENLKSEEEVSNMIELEGQFNNLILDMFKDEDNDSEYYNLQKQFELIKEEFDFKIVAELKQSITGFNHDKLEKVMGDYLTNIKAYINGETIFNEKNHKFEKPDEKKMRLIEKRMFVEEKDKEKFRNDVLKTIGTAVIEQGDYQDLDLRTIHKDLFKMLEDGMFEQKKSELKMDNQQLINAVEKYGTDRFEKFDPKQKKIISKTLDNMVKHYDYCESCAKDIFKYILKEELIKFEGVKNG